MGHDDFDDAPPPDEQGEDFANFDPESYLRRRNQGRYGEPTEPDENDQPLETDDFSRFDPNDYLKKRYSERSYLNQSSQERQAAYTGRSRRGRRNDPNAARVREIDRQLGGTERRGCLARLFDFSETAGLFREIVMEGGPVVRIVGCVIVIAILGLCVAGYLALSVLTRHP